MDEHFPTDIIYHEIFPKLRETDLILVSRAYPNFRPVIEQVLKSRISSQSSIVQQKQFNFHNSFSFPQLSPYSGSIVAYVDNVASTLRVLSSDDGHVLAETPLDIFIEIESLTFNSSENSIIALSRYGFSAFKFEKTVTNNEINASLKKVVSASFNPINRVIPENLGHPDFFSSGVICDVNNDGSLFAVAKISRAIKSDLEIKAYIRIDTVSGSSMQESNVDMVNVNFHSLPYFDNNVQYDNIIFTAREMIGCEPECRSLFLQSNLLLLLGEAQIILDPLRIYFPPTSESNFALLVNPSTADFGPWSRIVTDDEKYSVFKSSVAPVSGAFTIVWNVPRGVYVQRMCARFGSVKHSLSIPIPRGSKTLDFLESADGRTCVVLFGIRRGSSNNIYGWVVSDIEQKGMFTVTMRQQNFVSDSLTHSIGPSTDFFRIYDINNDGQLISAVATGNRHETTKKVVVFSAATGEIVTVTDTWPMEHLNGEPQWNEHINLNLGNEANKTYRVVFSRNVSNQLDLTSTAGNISWIGTKKLGQLNNL